MPKILINEVSVKISNDVPDFNEKPEKRDELMLFQVDDEKGIKDDGTSLMSMINKKQYLENGMNPLLYDQDDPVRVRIEDGGLAKDATNGLSYAKMVFVTPSHSFLLILSSG